MATHVYQVSVGYNSGGQFAITTHHFQFDDAGFTSTSAAALALITAFKAGNQASIVAALPAAVSILSYKGRAVNQTGGFEAVLPAGGSSTGTRSGTMQASGICPVLIFWPAGVIRSRGRTFVPGVSSSDAVDGILTASARTALQSLANSLRSSLTLVGGGAPVATAVIYSRKPVNIAHVIVNDSVSDMLGQIRRRQLPVQ